MTNDMSFTSSLFTIASFLYLSAMVFYVFYLQFQKESLGKFASLLGLIGVSLQIFTFFFRWEEAFRLTNHSIIKTIPVSNLYEALSCFAMLVALFYMIFEIKTKNRFLGVFAFGISGITSLFVYSIGLSSNINPLIPALQSNWLLAHVSLSFVAYTCFTVASFMALISLIKNTSDRKESAYIVWTLILGLFLGILLALLYDVIIGSFNPDYRIYIKDKGVSLGLLFTFVIFSMFFVWLLGIKLKNKFQAFDISIERLDLVTYKLVAAGFIIFTIGVLVFGAIWAEQAWGRYWAWDPKETFAFITWCIYGMYLHGRLYRNWSLNRANSIILIGMVITIFTFAGVNVLLSGLHSYGSIN